MTWESIDNPLDEPILSTRLPSGLRVLLNPRPRYHRTFAAFGTNFGSVDRVGGPAGEAVPAGLAHGLPVGVSFMGRRWSEGVLIRLAYGFEQATRLRQPPRYLPTVPFETD